MASQMPTSPILPVAPVSGTHSQSLAFRTFKHGASPFASLSPTGDGNVTGDQSTLPNVTPGSAEHVFACLRGGRGLACPHFPKYTTGSFTAHRQYPSRLGFFHAKSSKGDISYLETSNFCPGCLDQVVPNGYTYWSAVSDSNSADADGQRLAAPTLSRMYPRLHQAGTERFDQSTVRPQTVPDHLVKQSRDIPLPQVPGALEAWSWIQSQGKPFYIDALHLTNGWTPFSQLSIQTDAEIVRRSGESMHISRTAQVNEKIVRQQHVHEDHVTRSMRTGAQPSPPGASIANAVRNQSLPITHSIGSNSSPGSVGVMSTSLVKRKAVPRREITPEISQKIPTNPTTQTLIMKSSSDSPSTFNNIPSASEMRLGSKAAPQVDSTARLSNEPRSVSQPWASSSLDGSPQSTSLSIRNGPSLEPKQNNRVVFGDVPYPQSIQHSSPISKGANPLPMPTPNRAIKPSMAVSPPDYNTNGVVHPATKALSTGNDETSTKSAPKATRKLVDAKKDQTPIKVRCEQEPQLTTAASTCLPQASGSPLPSLNQALSCSRGTLYTRNWYRHDPIDFDELDRPSPPAGKTLRQRSKPASSNQSPLPKAPEPPRGKRHSAEDRNLVAVRATELPQQFQSPTDSRPPTKEPLLTEASKRKLVGQPYASREQLGPQERQLSQPIKQSGLSQKWPSQARGQMVSQQPHDTKQKAPKMPRPTARLTGKEPPQSRIAQVAPKELKSNPPRGLSDRSQSAQVPRSNGRRPNATMSPFETIPTKQKGHLRATNDDWKQEVASRGNLKAVQKIQKTKLHTDKATNGKPKTKSIAQSSKEAPGGKKKKLPGAEHKSGLMLKETNLHKQAGKGNKRHGSSRGDGHHGGRHKTHTTKIRSGSNLTTQIPPYRVGNEFDGPYSGYSSESSCTSYESDSGMDQQSDAPGDSSWLPFVSSSLTGEKLHETGPQPHDGSSFTSNQNNGEETDHLSRSSSPEFADAGLSQSGNTKQPLTMNNERPSSRVSINSVPSFQDNPVPIPSPGVTSNTNGQVTGHFDSYVDSNEADTEQHTKARSVSPEPLPVFNTLDNTPGALQNQESSYLSGPSIQTTSWNSAHQEHNSTTPDLAQSIMPNYLQQSSAQAFPTTNDQMRGAFSQNDISVPKKNQQWDPMSSWLSKVPAEAQTTNIDQHENSWPSGRPHAFNTVSNAQKGIEQQHSGSWEGSVIPTPGADPVAGNFSDQTSALQNPSWDSSLQPPVPFEKQPVRLPHQTPGYWPPTQVSVGTSALSHPGLQAERGEQTTLSDAIPDAGPMLNRDHATSFDPSQQAWSRGDRIGLNDSYYNSQPAQQTEDGLHTYPVRSTPPEQLLVPQSSLLSEAQVPTKAEPTSLWAPKNESLPQGNLSTPHDPNNPGWGSWDTSSTRAGPHQSQLPFTGSQAPGMDRQEWITTEGATSGKIPTSQVPNGQNPSQYTMQSPHMGMYVHRPEPAASQPFVGGDVPSAKTTKNQNTLAVAGIGLAAGVAAAAALGLGAGLLSRSTSSSSKSSLEDIHRDEPYNGLHGNIRLTDDTQSYDTVNADLDDAKSNASSTSSSSSSSSSSSHESQACAPEQPQFPDYDRDDTSSNSSGGGSHHFDEDVNMSNDYEQFDNRSIASGQFAATLYDNEHVYHPMNESADSFSDQDELYNGNGYGSDCADQANDDQEWNQYQPEEYRAYHSGQQHTDVSDPDQQYPCSSNSESEAEQGFVSKTQMGSQDYYSTEEEYAAAIAFAEEDHDDGNYSEAGSDDGDTDANQDYGVSEAGDDDSDQNEDDDGNYSEAGSDDDDSDAHQDYGVSEAEDDDSDQNDDVGDNEEDSADGEEYGYDY